MKTTSNFRRGLSAIPALALYAVSALSFAQPAAATEPTPSTTGCSVGCPGTAQVGVVTLGGIQGQFMGAFGSYNAAGEPVDDDSVTGDVEGWEQGEVHAFSDVTVNGPACVECADTSVNAGVNAWQSAGARVGMTGTRGGTVYGGASAAQAGTVSSIGVVFHPYTPPATPAAD